MYIRAWHVSRVRTLRRFGCVRRTYIDTLARGVVSPLKPLNTQSVPCQHPLKLLDTIFFPLPAPLETNQDSMSPPVALLENARSEIIPPASPP